MIYIALGSNLASAAGSPEDTINRAFGAFGAQGIHVERRSGLYRTPAWPNPNDPEFVNAVVAVRTTLGPYVLLKSLLAIERQFGRVRETKWTPRTLDLDILDYGGLLTDAPALMLPHPLMHERAFALVPLKEIAPDWRHPDTGLSIDQLLKIVGEEEVNRVRLISHPGQKS